MFTITDLKKYFTLGGCCDPERLVRAERTSYNKSFWKIFHFGRVFVVLEGQYIRVERASYNNKLRKNISLWEGVVVLKGWCVRPRYIARVESDSWKALWLYRGPGLLVFGLSHCDPSRVPSQWPLRPGSCHRECVQVARGQVTITENIWWPWKVNTLVRAERAKRAIYNNREYFTLGGCPGIGRPIHTSRESKLQ